MEIVLSGKLLDYAIRIKGNSMVLPSSKAGNRAAPLAPNEEARLAALAAYERAGATRRTNELDRIARLVARLTSTPIALVSLVGRFEQQFAGNFGLRGVDKTSRDVSFCAYTILGDDPFVVPDATRDSRFQQNALVTGDLRLRYYAGAPITTGIARHRLGAVCIIDKSARDDTSPFERALLTDMAKMAAMLIEEQARSSECLELSDCPCQWCVDRLARRGQHPQSDFDSFESSPPWL